MKNPHPCETLKCSREELESMMISLLSYKCTRYSREVIRRACSRIHGHSIRSSKYPVPSHLFTSAGQYGYRKEGEAMKFFKIASDSYYGHTIANSLVYEYASSILTTHYIDQLLIYSDIKKLEKQLEKYRAKV